MDADGNNNNNQSTGIETTLFITAFILYHGRIQGRGTGDVYSILKSLFS